MSWIPTKIKIHKWIGWLWHDLIVAFFVPGVIGRFLKAACATIRGSWQAIQSRARNGNKWKKIWRALVSGFFVLLAVQVVYVFGQWHWAEGLLAGLVVLGLVMKNILNRHDCG